MACLFTNSVCKELMGRFTAKLYGELSLIHI